MQITQAGPGGLLAIAGDLDITNAEALAGALREALAHEPALTVDLTAVESCDTACLQLLCAARRSAEQQRKPFRTWGMPEAVQNTATAIGLSLHELNYDPADRSGPNGI